MRLSVDDDGFGLKAGTAVDVDQVTHCEITLHEFLIEEWTAVRTLPGKQTVIARRDATNNKNAKRAVGTTTNPGAGRFPFR